MNLTQPSQLCDVLGIPFSDQQLDAIAAPLAPAVVIAGAGSGKTTVMAARVVWLVGSGQVQPGNVLGLTFTRKAAGELGGRIRRALADAGLADADSGEPLISTYDAFAGRLIDEHGLLLGFEPGLRMISGAVPYRLAARVVAEATTGVEALAAFTPATVAERVVALAREMRSHLVTPEQVIAHGEQFLASLDAAPRRSGTQEYKAILDARQTVAARRELVDLVIAYERRKAVLGYVEFADQMAMAARLAAEVPAVSSALREQFGAVLLDEYQDTSAAQAGLLRGLFSGPDADHGRGHPVTAVGDPCQAIYGWRGAAAGNILDFAVDFPGPDQTPAATYPLTTNRRSGQRILDAANEIAAQLRAEPTLSSHDLDFSLVAPSGTPAGRVEVVGFDTWPAELAALADRVADLSARGEVSNWSEVAVLCRTNTQVAAVFTALTERDIPAEIVGLGGLLDVPLVAEVVATLTVLADPTANPATIRLLTSSRWAIGLADLAMLGRRAVELARASAQDGAAAEQPDRAAEELPSLLEAVGDPGPGPYSPQARARLREFAAEIGALRRHAGDNLVELVSRVIAHTGVAVEAEVAHPGSSAPLGVLVQAVSGFVEVDADSGVNGLLAWFAAEREYDGGLDQAVSSDANSVKVLTVHKAKGLEWEVVFLPALVEKVFPSDRVSDDWVRAAAALPHPLRGDRSALPQLGAVSHKRLDSYHAELRDLARLSEDRLAYVAVTRARRLLIASSHVWAADLANPRAQSVYGGTLAVHADAVQVVDAPAATNPLAITAAAVDWPDLGSGESVELRRAAAAMVTTAREQLRAERAAIDTDSDAESLAQARRWRAVAEQLVARELADRRAAQSVNVDYLSVTGVGRLSRDPQAFAAGLRRPMPRLVGDAQRWGVGFHQWLENRFARQSSLLDEEPELELAGADFDHLRATFEAGPYADAVPTAVEAPFTLVLGGRLVRGRIDAVFATPDGGAQVVDWKTGRVAAADPMQLACYRLAWAELSGLDPEQVDAVFYDLHTGVVVRPGHLPGREELTRLLVERLD
jgi:DNA helicase-2/ATP-dependent DNA helicase PcrA